MFKIDRMTSKFLAVMYRVLFGFDEDNKLGPGGEADGTVELPFKLDELEVVLVPDKCKAGPTATTCICRSIESS